MPRSSIHLLAALLVATSAACENVPTEPDPALPAIGLGFRTPILEPTDLRSVELEEHLDPSRSAPEPVSFDAELGSIPQIFDPQTRVGFESGFAFALGMHKYSSNVGEVDVTAQVAYEGQHLGSQTATRRIYDPFFLNPFRRNRVFAWAKVFTDHDCGLSVQGSSQHRATWEFYQGRSVQKWGESSLTTQAAPAAQSACARNTATGMGSDEQAGGMICYYLITYDLDTGEVVNADFLYCSSGGGEVV